MKILVAILLMDFFILTAASPDTERLFDDLLNSYHVDVIPKRNRTDTVRLEFGMSLVDLDVDSNKNFDGIFYLRFKWNDYRLVWNAEEYGGMTEIRMPNQYVWKPDMKLYNSIPVSVDLDQTCNVLVYNNGDVLWIPRARLNTNGGHWNNTYYANFVWGSWTYDGFNIDLTFYDEDDSIDMSDYTGSSKYEITRTSMKKNTKYYPCCVEPYPDITATIAFSKIN